jgi:hypothetical protein
MHRIRGIDRMGFAKYANARLPAEILSDSEKTDSVFTGPCNNTGKCINTYITSLSDYTVIQRKAAEQIRESLVRMSPRYKRAVRDIQVNPLDYRISKLLGKLRPRYSSDRFVTLSMGLGEMSPMEQAAWCEQMEAALERDEQQ